jgi:hypothetical protein
MWKPRVEAHADADEDASAMNRTTLADASQLMTRDQQFALSRLDGLLQHREAVDVGPPSAGCEPWLLHALDAAIVSYYRSLASWMCNSRATNS